MKAKFQKFLNESTLPKEAKDMISEAWEAELEEAKQELAASLREEFAQKFEHDKAHLVETMDKYLSDVVRSEMEEFAKDKQALVAERVKAKTQVSEHIKLLDSFLVSQLAEEVKEFKRERVAVKENFVKLENFLIEQLAVEIKEFQADKRELVEQRVKLAREGKRQIAEAKRNFIAKAVKLVEGNIESIVKSEIEQYRNDIAAARENDFGRKIFEAYAAEYMTSYLNEGSKTKKLMNALTDMQRKLDEATKAIGDKQKLVESMEHKLKAEKSRATHQKVLSEMLSTLNKDKRQVMSELLEGVTTDKLQATFDKYLPAVLGNTAGSGKSATLNESYKSVDGSRAKAPGTEPTEVSVNELKKLAGIKN